MTIEILKEKLKQGVYEFSYIKKDGSIRSARGTTNLDILKQNNAEPKGTSEKQNSDLNIRYYDLDSRGCRSFRIENLL